MRAIPAPRSEERRSFAWPAVALDGGRGRLRALVRQQEAIAELGRRVLAGMDADRLLAECAALVARTLGVEACAVLELSPKDSRFLVRAAAGLPAGAEGRTLSDTAFSLAGQALRTTNGAPLVVSQSRQASEEETVFGLPVRAALAVAVGGHDARPPFGVLAAYAAGARRRFTQDDVFFAQFIANTAAAALERARQDHALRLGEARYQRIAAHTPGMVYQFRLRPDGGFTFPFVTEGCREMFDLEPQAIYDNPLVVIGVLHEADRDTLFPAILASAGAMAPFHWMGRYVTAAGETRWMRADSRPERQPDGDVIWDGIMFDVTELKRAQEEMRAAKEEAEKANRAKSEFLSRISHELRTPLNAILGFSQFLQRQRPPGDPAHECLGHIARAGTHLLGLINEVLNLSRIEAGHAALDPVPVDVDRAVGEAFALVRAQAEERGITLLLEHPARARRLQVLADPQRFSQILLNLFSNAVKYNRNAGGVRVACVRREAGTVEIAVSDDGPGVSADKLGRLFVAFDRLGAEATSVPGTGLGLVLSKCLAEALGGTLTADSTPPGGGAVFRLLLPAAPSMPLPCRDPASPSDPPVAPTLFRGTHRVLYIEDNASNRFLIERLLEAHPQITLETAALGADGLDLLTRRPPDLLLLDLHLPDISGEEVLARVRGAVDPGLRRLPVIVMSADATATSIERLLARGANAYLTKPLDLPALLATLQRTLEHPPEPTTTRAARE